MSYGGHRYSRGLPSRNWIYSEERFKKLNADGRIWWGADGNNNPAVKRFRSEVMQGRVPQTLWAYSEVGHTQEAKKELMEFVSFKNTENVLDTVKPTRLLRHMLQLGTEVDAADVVLDFFGGSGPTGHAVLAQNAEDGGNRRFVLVQLPEPLPVPESSLRTIADITKERVRRVIKKLNDEDSAANSTVIPAKAGTQDSVQTSLSLDSGQSMAGMTGTQGNKKQDRGFKVFKLAESNFKPWNAEVPKDDHTLALQLENHINHIRDGRTDDDLLYELLLKSWHSPALTERVEKLTFAGKTVFSVASGLFFICLDRELTLELIRAMADNKPERVVCLDEGFAGNDQLKANAVQIFKTKGVTSFKTV